MYFKSIQDNLRILRYFIRVELSKSPSQTLWCQNLKNYWCLFGVVLCVSEEDVEVLTAAPQTVTVFGNVLAVEVSEDKIIYM